MLCVWSDQSEFMTIFMVCIVLICGVFRLYFFKLVVVFNFSVPFSSFYNPGTCSVLRCVSKIFEVFFGTR